MSVTREIARQQNLNLTAERVADVVESNLRFRASMANRGSPPLARSGGAYNENDEWVEYWKAGQPVGSRPIRPN